MIGLGGWFFRADGREGGESLSACVSVNFFRTAGIVEI